MSPRFRGASLLALALVPTPLLAQSEPAIPDTVQGHEDQTGIDTLVTDDASSATPAVAPTGDPVLDRLNALEAKIAALEARNKQLEDQAATTQDRVEKVEVRAAKGVQPGVAPTFADVNDNFSFKPRGTFQIDYAGFNERAGGYDYNNGTDIRRGRFGFDGTAFKDFKWRIEAELVKSSVTLLDAYVSYTGLKKWTFTVGQQKAPYGLEANTSDAFNSFLERGMANVAFGAVGAERRIGVSAAYVPNDKITATVGLFGASEAALRNATTPDETYGVNARLTWEPIQDTGKLVHLGVSGFRVTNLPGGTVTLADRPGTRVDDGRLVTATLGPVTTGPLASQTLGAKDATYLGGEAAIIFGPFSAQGEYSRLKVDRFGTVPSATYDGFYIFATAFLTGESRSFSGGTVARVRPLNSFNPANGTWGAFELAARYDQLDLTDTGISPLGRKGETWTAGLNWYLNPNLKFVFNYIRFEGENSPLYVLPTPVAGTGDRTAKGDAFATRMQLDF
jgi:phosphate-selective porin OprO/OprP